MESPALYRPYRLALSIGVLAFVLDRLSKWWIMDVLMLPTIKRVPLVPGFTLQWAENTGISFSLLRADSDVGRWALTIMSLAIVIGLGFWLKNVQTRLTTIAIGLVMGGAVGNIYDRIIFGYVADFLQFHGIGWSFAIFNLADSAITLGAVLVIWDSFFGSNGAENEKKNNIKE